MAICSWESFAFLCQSVDFAGNATEICGERVRVSQIKIQYSDIIGDE